VRKKYYMLICIADFWFERRTLHKKQKVEKLNTLVMNYTGIQQKEDL
jgi:hypothetical protein